MDLSKPLDKSSVVPEFLSGGREMGERIRHKRPAMPCHLQKRRAVEEPAGHHVHYVVTGAGDQDSTGTRRIRLCDQTQRFQNVETNARAHPSNARRSAVRGFAALMRLCIIVIIRAFPCRYTNLRLGV